MKKRLLEIYSTYFNKKMLIMTTLGFASGFPFLLVFNTLSLWLKDVHWSYAAIGAFSLVKIPYALKFLISPFMDCLKIPLLSRLGRRRSFGLVAQLGLFFAIFLMSRWTPSLGATYLVLSALAVSFFSAMLDIVLDAFRVELFAKTPEDQGAASAIFVLGYRIGLLFSGAGALGLASFVSWNTVYLVAAFGSFVGIITLLVVKEPISQAYKAKESLTLQAFVTQHILAPIKDLTATAHWKLVLCLIFIYRLSDAYVGPMSYPFYDDMGFSKLEIAYVIKIYGMLATIFGGIYGGLFLKRVGIYKGLYICAYIQGLTTAFYALQACVGHNLPLLILTISLENFSSGMATACLVAYMSSLCNIAYTATQYALLSSLTALARDFFAATSGFVLQLTSWPVFFILAGLLCLPAAFLVKKIELSSDASVAPKQNIKRTASAKL